jgi:hypothetical protein
MKFYIRLGILTGRYVNRCLVFNGLNIPYWCNATEIRGDLTFKQIKLL